MGAPFLGISMSFISNEFLYLDPEFSGFGDFTDNSVFSPDERREFLSHYAEFLKSGYGLGEASLQAVDRAEVAATLEGWDKKEGPFTSVSAYTLNKAEAYKGWQLYTDTVSLQGDTLVFASADLPPNPCAQYTLKARPRALTFTFFMDEEYTAPVNGIIRDTTTARTIELRQGIEDILKIGFYSNGEAYARVFSADPYHSRFVRLGSFDFGRENALTLSLEEDTYSVRLNSDLTESIPYSSPLTPDRLFISTGMFSYGEWRITPKSVTFEDGEDKNLFLPAEKAEDKPLPLGEVTLPYCIGGADFADKTLVIEKRFTLPTAHWVTLTLNSLDPGGEVYIDGRLLASTHNFERFSLDISNLERDKDHLLQVRVFPRAPETLFAWHRQKDPYNGWFCGEISIKGYNEISLTEPRVRTLSVKEDKISANFSGRVSEPCEIRITATPCFGKSGDTVTLGAFAAEGEFCHTADFEANPWDTHSPNLYSVTFTAFKDGQRMDDETVETGFRTIEQKEGEILLNGRRIDLNGALLMQFLPPYKETSRYHICPTDEQVLWQEMQLLALGGNTLRLHVLGYGVNDPRYAHYADRLGLLLIWTTRYIDSIEGVQWQGKWRGKEAYIRQIKEVINHPSIIMWEGSNELRPDIQQINSAFDHFVPAVREADPSRLICPVSHLYYAADLYPTRGCEYLSEDGISDHKGDPATVSPYWHDPLVVRSAHTYSLLCGYGSGWDKLRLQPWGEQDRLFASKKHSYIVSEYAVIGRQDPNTPEAKEDYFNPYSYEFPDEKPLGLEITGDDWLISQAHQALCAHHSIKTLRQRDADGMLWCCLMGGANDGGYLKPVIDNYGYAKLGFYAMRAALQEICAFLDSVDLKRSRLELTPLLFGKVGHRYSLTLQITDRQGTTLEEHTYSGICCKDRVTTLPPYRSALDKKGYYGIRFTLLEE